VFGILYFGALLAYLLASLLIASLVAWIARTKEISVWKWGLPAFVLMLGLVFWDWIPMEVMFHYNCEKYSGFTLYKTLDEWKQENPDVAETLIAYDNIKPIMVDGRERYQLNQRFAWEITHKSHWFHIREREERIVDTKIGELWHDILTSTLTFRQQHLALVSPEPTSYG
jgi:hypothetical protein